MPTITPIMKKQVTSFMVTGLSTKTQNSDEFNDKTAKLPGLWQQFYSSDLAGNANLFEVYSDYESDATGLYTVTLGVADTREGAAFASVKIEAGNYLVFQATGPMPAAVIETWKQIWEYFDVQGEYRRRFISDYEVYSSPDKAAIYIGIE